MAYGLKASSCDPLKEYNCWWYEIQDYKLQEGMKYTVFTFLLL